MTPEQRNIQSFLKLGYFIHFDGDVRPIDYSGIDRKRWAGASKDELERAGIDVLRSSIAALWAPGDNVVPLSGGMDSRLILAALLEHTEAANLRTVTYGVPGSYDFEIGCNLAKFLGTRHVAIPINRYSYHLDELLETSHRTQNQCLLFHHPPLREMDLLFGGATIWSGYVGDAVAGSYLHNPPATSLEAARREHLHHRRFVRSVTLHTCTDDDLIPYMGGGELDPEVLSWDEQVLFAEAGRKFTAPMILFTGFRWLTPLINTPWMDFMFGVPGPHRLGEKLMFDIGKRAYPKIFGFPCKNRTGHTLDTPDAVVRATFWLNRVRKRVHRFFPSVSWPNTLYDDFNTGLRQSADLRSLVQGQVEDLRKRGVCDWVDFDGLWRRHDRYTHDHGDALVTLASLEIVLKAREQAARAGQGSGTAAVA